MLMMVSLSQAAKLLVEEKRKLTELEKDVGNKERQLEEAGQTIARLERCVGVPTGCAFSFCGDCVCSVAREKGEVEMELASLRQKLEQLEFDVETAHA